MWQDEELRDSSISHLDALFDESTAASKLIAAEQYCIEHWKYEAIKQLVLRKASLTSKDIDLLGAEISASIMLIRENHREAKQCIHIDCVPITTTNLIFGEFGYRPPTH
jgi:hypothetical protein